MSPRKKDLSIPTTPLPQLPRPRRTSVPEEAAAGFEAAPVPPAPLAPAAEPVAAAAAPADPPAVAMDVLPPAGQQLADGFAQSEGWEAGVGWAISEAAAAAAAAEAAKRRSRYRAPKAGVRIGGYVPAKLEERVRVRCLRERRSLSDALTEALTLWMAEKKAQS